MTITANELLDSLLKHNFFPAYNQWLEEVPPILTSENFNAQLAKSLVDLPTRSRGRFRGYDSIQYRLTRFNGVSRTCSIVHPKAYAELAQCIHDNWSDISYISDNIVSMVRPVLHEDGRVFVMNYLMPIEALHENKDRSFGKKYVAISDISSFYPSFYSHSIPWAVVGIKEAKADTSNKLWYNALDSAVRQCNRGETRGVAIGPGTSSIVTEMNLAVIDKELSKKYEYTRHIDDYVGYFVSEDEAEQFIAELGDRLRDSQLEINMTKTHIDRLPVEQSPWIADLGIALPKGPDIPKRDIDRFLDFAIRLADQTPDGSVLKFALKSLVANVVTEATEPEIVHVVLERALNLAFHEPVLIPMLGQLLDAEAANVEVNQHADELLTLLKENVRFARSDMVSWLLYFCHRHDVFVPKDVVSDIIASGDCLPTLLVYMSEFGPHQQKVIAFANSLDNYDLYEMDRYWLLLYQLYCDGVVSDPDSRQGVYRTLKASGMSFIRKIEKCVYFDENAMFDI